MRLKQLKKKRSVYIYIHYLWERCLLEQFMSMTLLLRTSLPHASINLWKNLSENFNIKEMGKLRYFLRVEVVYPESGKIWIGQTKHTAEVLKKFQMENLKPTITPCDTGMKLTKATSEGELFDKEVYQSAIGSLLSINEDKTRYCLCCWHCSKILFPTTKEHWTAAKHILRYLNGTRNYGLFYSRGCPCGVMVKAMDCGIVVREFVPQSRYYIHFRANTLGERYEPPYPPSYGLNSTTTVLLGEWLWH